MLSHFIVRSTNFLVLWAVPSGLSKANFIYAFILNLAAPNKARYLQEVYFFWCDSDTNSLRQLFWRSKRIHVFKLLRPQIYLDFNKSCQLYLPNYLDPKNAASYPNLAPKFKPPLSSQRELITLLTYKCGCLYLSSTSIRAVL